MKTFLLPLCAVLCASASVYAADVSFEGSQREIIKITPERNTGLDMVYVAFDTSSLTRMVISGVSQGVAVSRYSNLGGGFAESVPVSYDGADAVVSNPAGDLGYIITDNGKSTYIWLVNYAAHYLRLESAAPAAQQDCNYTYLDINGSGDAIHYFTIDGRQVELSREIEAKYLTLEWDENAEAYQQVSRVKDVPHLSNPVVITPPLYCNSVFHVSGDRFLKQWGLEQSVQSSLVYANGLDVHTKAEQTNLPDDGPDAPPSNVIKSETQGMGGSAPADISFRAYVTDAVIHNEWQIASDEMFEYIDYRFNEQNLDYTFTDEGTYYVRFVGSNSDGSCEAVGETYTVSIGASDLRIPNAFTPNGDGVNDEWKVAYRSLLKFSCTIFDRYGNEIFKFSDPSLGWDGKYKGKLVKPGVYFYVIEAVGADGKKYKKGGDINIIRSKRYSNSTDSVE